MTPITDKPAAAPETVEARFRRLEAAWRVATSHLSSPTKMIGHPAFQEIIGLGDAVVPFLLRDLEERPRLWVWALPEITGANPVVPADAGDITKMSAAWLAWARERGYKW